MSRSTCIILLSLSLASCRSAADPAAWAKLETQFEAAEEIASAEVVDVSEPAPPLLPVVDLATPDGPVDYLSPAFARGPVIEEMRRLWIRDPELLLETLESARVDAEQPPLAFLLAIAHAETNGRPLLASEAGAVGLAQATPTAFLIEEQKGPLYVTAAYADGMRAYVMKKPIGDAVAAVSAALGERRRPASEALALIEEARALGSVGVDEVRLLAPWFAGSLDDALESDRRRNEAVLDAAERVIRAGDPEAMRTFRDSTRDAYRALMEHQRRSWKSYYDDLCARRDALLREEFGSAAQEMRGLMAYNAGEYLARVFDARFSPSQSAAFLVRHLDRKISEAQALEQTADDLTGLAAALYNGGAHNVLRMRVGLIVSLQETERYSEKVPSTRRRIEQAMAQDAAPPGSSGGG